MTTSKHQKISAIRGMGDIVPPATVLWQQVESTAQRIFALYGYEEIRTPLVEPAELFERGVGETTSIVEKEMYTFTDKGGDRLSLRPEGTASVVRAYIEQSLHAQDSISRLWYRGPMFRRERPQKGRQRQFHQIGAELFGATSPYADAEVIAMCAHLFGALRLDGISLELNSIGCTDCRPAFHAKLVGFLQQQAAKLCEDCNRRIDTNPLRALDCKNPVCQGILNEAPTISSSWCETCRTHFNAVQEGLSAFHVPFVLNERIVRGLDYYMRTAFEFLAAGLGAQNAVAAGGRYDGLVSDLGGPDIPGVGFAIGVERLVMLLENNGGEWTRRKPLVYVAPLSAAAVKELLPEMAQLRRKSVSLEWDYEARSLKSLLRRADKQQATWVVIVGDDEVKKGVAMVRNMQTKEQREVDLKQLPDFFSRASV